MKEIFLSLLQYDAHFYFLCTSTNLWCDLMQGKPAWIKNHKDEYTAVHYFRDWFHARLSVPHQLPHCCPPFSMRGTNAHSFLSVLRLLFRHHDDQPGEAISGLSYLRSLLVLRRSVRSSYKGESTNFDKYRPSSAAVAALGCNLGEYCKPQFSYPCK
jgi:hypothetical protein